MAPSPIIESAENVAAADPSEQAFEATGTRTSAFALFALRWRLRSAITWWLGGLRIVEEEMNHGVVVFEAREVSS